MSDDMPAACERCRWHQPIEEARGECHVAPPTAVHLDLGEDSYAVLGHWPAVDDDGWCAEFAPHGAAPSVVAQVRGVVLRVAARVVG
jgi:hypothetical protein